MEYKLAVIIPVYNAERYLHDAIKSVISQTLGFPSIQLLICDDHSTDNSWEIIKKYEKRYSNIKALQTKANSGSASEPRNICLNNVTAPFVMFLDNDDLLPNDACKSLYESIEGTDYDFVCGCYEELHYDKKIRQNNIYDSVLERSFLLPDNMIEIMPFVYTLWGKIFRTSTINEYSIKFDLGVYGEDTIFMHKYIVRSNKAYHIKNVVYTYRVRDNSLYHIMNVEHFRGVVKGDEIIRKILEENNQEDYWKAFLVKHVSGFLEVMINSDISEKELRDVIHLWIGEIKEASLAGMPADTPYGEIIFRAAYSENAESIVEDVISIYKICKEKNGIIKDYMNSKIWKAVTKINQVLRR